MKRNDELFEDFIKGISATAFGTSAAAEKPFPMTDSLVLWYDLFVIKAYPAFKKMGLENYSQVELKEIFPTVSNLRFILFKMMYSYIVMTEEHKKAAKEAYQYLFNFLLKTIHNWIPDDSFCKNSNLYYTQKEVNQKISQLKLTTVQDINESKFIARLNLGLTSIVHGVYNDIVTDYGIDVYGPYPVSVDGKEYSLLLKHFPDLNPGDLNWPDQFLPKVKEVFLYLFYEDMEWEIKGVGCHTNIISGNPITNLAKYAVVADGQILDENQIQVLTKDLLKKSQDLYLYIIDSGFEEQKKQALFQECFQLKKISDKAGLDWKPNQELIDRMKGKKIKPSPNIIRTMEEYRRSLKVDQFKKDIVL